MYYKTALQNDLNIDNPEKIVISTIHAAKGGEADHVILALDFTTQVYRHYIKYPDSELRCLYVGATRARKRLTLKEKSGEYGYPQLY